MEIERKYLVKTIPEHLEQSDRTGLLKHQPGCAHPPFQ